MDKQQEINEIKALAETCRRTVHDTMAPILKSMTNSPHEQSVNTMSAALLIQVTFNVAINLAEEVALTSVKNR